MDGYDWDERYRTGGYTAREHPSPLLVDTLEWLPDGRALDVASGPGRNALYLADAGYDVDAVDVSREALEIGRRRAEQQGVSVNWIQADVTAGALPSGSYDAVIVSYFSMYERLCEIKDRLAPGGVLLYEHHLRSASPVERGPSDDRYRFGSNDLLRLCSDLTVLRYAEAERTFDRGERAGQTAAIASLVARNSSGSAQTYPAERRGDVAE